MNIQTNVNLRPYNSFHLDCLARYFVVIESEEDFLELMQTDIYHQNKNIIIGGGSNILLTQDTYEWLVIKNEIMWKEIIDETDTQVTIKIGWWEDRDSFVSWAIQRDYCGMENLVSIPGTVWAAPMQNIWAYGVQIQDLVQNVWWIDIPSATHIILANYECNFWYRDSIFKQALKNNFYISHVTIILDKYSSQTYFPNISYGAIQDKLAQISHWVDLQLSPKLIADVIASIRESKLPNWKEIGTAGSFFKNPIVSKEKYKQLQSLDPSIKWYPVTKQATLPWQGEVAFVKQKAEGFTTDKQKDRSKSRDLIKLNAWQLIDLAWLKGLQHGNVGTYHKHALVLINNGQWTGQELVELAARIQKIVKESFDVEIIPEVNYID